MHLLQKLHCIVSEYFLRQATRGSVKYIQTCLSIRVYHSEILLFQNAYSITHNFENLNNGEKTTLLINHPDLVRVMKKICYSILNHGTNILCSKYESNLKHLYKCQWNLGKQNTRGTRGKVRFSEVFGSFL